MKTYKYVCLSTATDNRFDELEEWYTSQHFHDILGIPCFVGVQAFRCAEPQFRQIDRPLPYIVIWDVEAETQEDADAAFEVMRQNGKNGTTIFSDAFGDWWDMCVEPISAYVTKDEAAGKSVAEVFELAKRPL